MSEKDQPLLVRVFGERRVLRFQIKWSLYIGTFGAVLLLLWIFLAHFLSTTGPGGYRSIAAMIGFRFVFGYDLKAVSWWILLASILTFACWHKLVRDARYVRETTDILDGGSGE